MTCNDFSLEGPWHENVWAPLLYILMIGEARWVTAWHLCSCDIIKMLIWQHTNYVSWRDDTGKHLAPPLSLTWPFTAILRSSDTCPLLCCPLSFSLSLFFPSIHSLHPKVNHRRVDALSRKLVNVFSPRRCYLLPADRAMNSGPTWNSYCYQKHKIPITLGVRAETRKWNRYS